MEYNYMWQKQMPQQEMQSKNTYPWDCIKTCGMEGKKEEKKEYLPLMSMGPEIYSYVYKIVILNINKHMPDVQKMPKAISKNEYYEIVNDCMCELTKEEKSYKEMLKSRATREDEDTRAFCKNCNGLLKTVVEVAVISSLLNGGCMFCY